MPPYDPSQPLIFIHVPKTAGASVKAVVDSWFPGRMHQHYFNEQQGGLPERLDLDAPAYAAAPPLIYGHFNRNRKFGVEDYYPQVRQFATILRDPFDMHLSRYFFTRKVSGTWKTGSDIGDVDLLDHIETGHLNMLEHFPRPVTADNYRDIIDEFFVALGTFETLEQSLRKMANIFGKPTAAIDALPHRNQSDRDQVAPPGAYGRFRDRWPLEFEVYDYVRNLA